jgi:hypothetical protein
MEKAAGEGFKGMGDGSDRSNWGEDMMVPPAEAAHSSDEDISASLVTGYTMAIDPSTWPEKALGGGYAHVV